MIQDLILSHHANSRMRQRGFRDSDIKLLLNTASQVENNIFELTGRDVNREIKECKRKIQSLERLKGARMVIKNGVLVTCFHAT